MDTTEAVAALGGGGAAVLAVGAAIFAIGGAVAAVKMVKRVF